MERVAHICKGFAEISVGGAGEGTDPAAISSAISAEAVVQAAC